MKLNSSIFNQEEQVYTEEICKDIEAVIGRIKLRLLSGREASVAITHLETAQLWLTQAQDIAPEPAF